MRASGTSSPNFISLAGMFAGIGAGVAFAFTTHSEFRVFGFVLGAILIQIRLLANMFDGMVAIESGKSSPIGELFNEVPDRVSDTAAFVGAGYAVASDPILGFTAACLAIFLAYIRAQGKAAGAHQEFCGPMAKPHRMFVLTVLALYCGLAPLKWQSQVAVAGPWGVMAWGLCFIILGEVLTVFRRLWRIGRALGKSQS